MKIVFVCTGNTCRSPMLKYMFEDYANKNGLKINVDSAGMMNHNKSMNVNTNLILNMLNIPHENFVSKILTKEIFDSSNYVFAMTTEIKSSIELMFGKNDKIKGLYDFYGEDIFDPYGMGLDAYKKVEDIFEAIIPSISKYIYNI